MARVPSRFYSHGAHVKALSGKNTSPMPTLQSKPIGSKKPSVISTLHRIFSEFVEPPERRRLFLALVALVLSSSTNLAFPTIMGRTIDFSTSSDEPAPRLHILAYTVGSILTLGALASVVRVYSLKITSHRVQQKMRLRLYRSLLQQELEFFTTERLGELQSRLLHDVEVAANCVTDNVAQTLRGLNSSGMIMLLLLSPRLTGVTLSLVPVIGLGITFYSRRAKGVARSLIDATSQAASHGEERIAAIETVRSFGMEEHEANQFAFRLNGLYGLARKAACIEGFMMGGISVAVNVSLLAVLFFGGSLVRKGSMSVGNLTTFALYSSMVGLGLTSLSRVYTECIKGCASADRIFETLDKTPPDLNEGRILAKGEIEFKDIGFSYKTRSDVVLQDFSLRILPGQVVAIAGRSGSGKTTVSRLLSRVLTPQKGTIFIDGHDLTGLNPTWLRTEVFGIVTQEPVLFDMCIRDNIRYGKPEATEEEVEEASIQANAHEFIKQLSQGYQTRIGERGCQLSVGQRQRIAIARALLKNAPCLILDEATSSLDGESERLVQQALERLMAGRTTLIIAHRPSTLNYAQKIEILDEGKIVASGTFAELKAESEIFKKLILGGAAS